MRHPFIITLLLVAASFFGAFWFDASALVNRWDTKTALHVRPPAKTVVPLGASPSLELQGEGLDKETRVWLVPETTQRLALTASFKTWGNPYRFQKRGNRVYLANYTKGVLALDLSDWSQPHLLSGMQLPGQALDLEVLGTQLFVACGSAGLQIVDFLDPKTPKLLATLPLPGAALAVHLQEGRLYIAGGKAGLFVVDVSNPAHPFLLAQSATTTPALDVTVSGTTALLACGRSGICRFDITIPQRPRPLPAIPRPGFVRCLEGSGALVFVGSSEKRTSSISCLLSVHDCSDPARPQLLTERALVGDPLTIQIQEHQLTVAQSFNGVSIFDIADPGRPLLLDTINSIGSARGAITEGDWVLIADGTGYLHTTRRSNQLHLPVINKIANRISSVPLLQDGRMLCPLRNLSLQIYAATDPTRPEWLANLPLPGTITAMLMRGDLLLLSVDLQRFDADSKGGRLLVVSLDDPTHPQILSSLTLPAAPKGLALDGDRLVLSLPSQPLGRDQLPDGIPRGRLIVFDLSDPRRPTRRDEIELMQTPTGLVWQDGYALVSTEEGKLLSVQVPEQRSPAVVGEIEFPWLHQGGMSKLGGGRGGGRRGGIKLVGRVAAVFFGSSELGFVDVAVPSRPVLLGTSETPGFIESLDTADNVLYVGIINKGIMVYDLSLPWQPRQAGMLPMPLSTNYFAIGDQSLWYGSNTRLGLTCIPKPVLVAASIDAEGSSLELELSTPLAAGDYSLWVERDNDNLTVANSVRFSER